ncbi:MAG: hypothetical protein ACK5LJ_08160 [Paracoccus sp. (in: a-proteobacteria)]
MYKSTSGSKPHSLHKRSTTPEKDVNAMVSVAHDVVNQYHMSSVDSILSGVRETCGTPSISGCGSENTSLRQSNGCLDNFARLELLDKHLPSLRSTVTTLTSLILSRELESVSGDESDDEKLRNFLLNRNLSGEANSRELSQGIAHALIYGRCGFRYISEKDGFVFVPSNRYSVVYRESEDVVGVNEVVGYVIARPHVGNAFGDDYEISNETFTIDFEEEIAQSENYVYLTSDMFYNFYFDGDAIESDTPLNHDVDRINLFLYLAIQLQDSVSNANKDVILIKLAQDLFARSHSQASDLVATSKTAKDAKKANVSRELDKFSKVVANSTGRDSLVVPPTVDEFEELASEIQISDYMSLYEYMESFIAALYGLSSNVLTLEDMPRDASANPIFEQMMKTSIYPKRKVILEFVNQFLSPKLGLGEMEYQEESYAMGLRIQNAQSLATVIATIETDTRSVPDELVEMMMRELLRKK